MQPIPNPITPLLEMLSSLFENGYLAFIIGGLVIFIIYVVFFV